MSVTKRVKQGFLRLPGAKKAILLSSATLMISGVLPWYDNRNSFGVGETYLGVEGPLFLAGILVMAFGAVSFFNLFFPLMGRNFFKLRRKSGMVSLLLGFQSLFLLIIANSVFYHPSFGTNLSHKATRFGMLIAFASIAFMVIAGYLANRREQKGEYDEDIEDIMTNVEPVQTVQPMPQPILQPTYSAPISRPVQTVRATPQPELRPQADSEFNGDPLTLDAKTRYKMMRQQMRKSQEAQSNLWQNAPKDRPAYGGGPEVTDSMKIRTDL